MARIERNGQVYSKQIALVLQGGGALGSYQAGVYEALHEAGYEPEWIAGISIGAINSAIIAGNPPEARAEKLRDFWRSITTELPAWPLFGGALPRDLGRQAGALSALINGQPGFFKPWLQSAMPLFGGAAPLSFYDTRDLKTTLERLVDFDRINAKEIRFSVGAVNVKNGNFAYFDNREITIRPEHVMASGALPPGFPAVEIDGESYWDGGLVSNTPLQYLLEYMPRYSTLAFQVDLFSAEGRTLDSLATVMERQKDIQYSSKTRASTDNFRYAHNLRRTISQLLKKLPAELQGEPEVEHLRRAACMTTMDIVELIYRPELPQGQSKDYEFSRGTMETRWAQGLADARRTLAAAPWFEPSPPEIAVRTFDVQATPGHLHVTGSTPATMFPKAVPAPATAPKRRAA
jgi:NTE family protein